MAIKITIRACLTYVFLSIAMNTYSQEWKKGEIIKQPGDTLRGEILFEDWDISPGSISFRATEKDSPNAFEAKNIFGFSIFDPKFEFQSKAISIKYYFTSPVGPGQSPVENEFIGTIFLEVLLKSETVTLFSLLDNLKRERFFIKKNNQTRELLNIDYYQATDGERTFHVQRPFYREQLKQTLSECPTLNTADLSYTSGSLIKLLKSYHNYCKINYDVSFEQKKTHDHINFGIVYGPMYGVDLQILSRKNFHNTFAILEFGKFINTTPYPNLQTGTYFGVYGGKYFGSRRTQPFAFMGGSSIGGLEVGAGIAYQKRIAISVHESVQWGYAWLKLRVNF